MTNFNEGQLLDLDKDSGEMISCLTSALSHGFDEDLNAQIRQAIAETTTSRMLIQELLRRNVSRSLFGRGQTITGGPFGQGGVIIATSERGRPAPAKPAKQS